MLEGQAQRDTFSIRINAFALIDVKQLEVAKGLVGGLNDAGVDFSGMHLVVDDNRNIAPNFGKSLQWRSMGQSFRSQQGQFQLKQIDRLVQTQGLLHSRIHQAHMAHPLAVAVNGGALAGMQRGDFRGLEAELIRQTRETDNGLYISLDIEEVDILGLLRPVFW